MSAAVKGYCPMGCGTTLFLGSGGYVTCSYSHCPNPGAAAGVLDEQETEHVVVLRDQDFTVRHPLRERLDGELEDCQIHRRIKALSGPPHQIGTYRVYLTGTGWVWEAKP